MMLLAPAGTEIEIGELPTDSPNQGAYVTNAEKPDLGNSVVGGDVAEQTGSYCVHITGADGAVSDSIEYTLTIERINPNEHRESATPIETDETIEGVIAGYDHDWYAVDANDGDELTIACEIV